MIVNKKALVALAAYVEATCGNKSLTENDRKLVVQLCKPCIDEEFKYESWIMRGEIFFRAVKMEDAYIYNYSGVNVGKLLRYIAKNSKLPRNRSLTQGKY